MPKKWIVDYKDKKNLVEFLKYKAAVSQRYKTFVDMLMKKGDEEYKKAANLVMWF